MTKILLRKNKTVAGIARSMAWLAARLESRA